MATTNLPTTDTATTRLSTMGPATTDTTTDVIRDPPILCLGFGGADDLRKPPPARHRFPAPPQNYYRPAQLSPQAAARGSEASTAPRAPPIGSFRAYGR